MKTSKFRSQNDLCFSGLSEISDIAAESISGGQVRFIPQGADVPANADIILYDKNNRQEGDKLVISGTEPGFSISNLGAAVPGWNDRFGSFEIVSPDVQQWTFYAENDFGGDLGVGDSNFPLYFSDFPLDLVTGGGKDLDNRISSFRRNY